MTKDKDFKQLARARSARTGETYTTARRNLAAKSAEVQPEGRVFPFSRASKGYRGKGAKPTGYEHHVVVLRGGSIEITSSSAHFRNYGLHHLSVSGRRDNNSSTFIYNPGRSAVIVELRLEASTWTGVAMQGEFIDLSSLTHAEAMALGESFAIDAPDGIESIPSVLARFLPLTLPRDKGDLAEYVPIPEDGFPVWKPTGVKSWFPLMGASRESLITPRVITGGGLAGLKVGRKTIEAYRYDHVDREGRVDATTWIDEADNVVQFERTGLMLKAVSEDEARKLDPGNKE